MEQSEKIFDSIVTTETTHIDCEGHLLKLEEDLNGSKETLQDFYISIYTYGVGSFWHMSSFWGRVRILWDYPNQTQNQQSRSK